MKDNKDINKIRELIARWYSGETTPADDRELRTLLSTHPSLPPDLETERAFFAAILEPEMNLPEIPTEYSIRISDALENEISKSKDKEEAVLEQRKDIDSSAFHSVRRRWMWAAAGVAVCLMGSFITFRLLNTPELEGNKNLNVAVNIAVPKAPDDTIQMHTLSLSPELALSHIASANVDEKKTLIRKKAKSVRKSVNRRSEEISFDGWDEYENGSEVHNLSPEEKILANNNYHVVRSEEEAESIINSIFGRMDSQVAMETGRLSLIESDYSSEIEEISNKYNTRSSNEQYHEYTPI